MLVILAGRAARIAAGWCDAMHWMAREFDTLSQHHETK
jgi:hypothetical protein